jgi:hypothetical protein
MQVVNKELLETHQTQLMQKESTGLCALLQDDKKDGMSHCHWPLLDFWSPGADASLCVFPLRQS